jgi:hypothetical protein
MKEDGMGRTCGTHIRGSDHLENLDLDGRALNWINPFQDGDEWLDFVKTVIGLPVP